MPELRKDPVAGEWVIIGTERPRRPEDFRSLAAPRAPGPCLLCGGNERETPPELLAYRSDGGPANAPGWRVRVVPSKFPTLRVEGELERRGHGLYDLMNGVGAHEVVVESPRHDDTLATLPLAGLEDVVHAFQERMRDLRRDTRFRSIVVYKPGDRGGGPPFDHPHSQILATPTPPPDLQRELAQARAYHEYRERCLLCDILRQETDEGLRVVVESEHVVGFIPFAARTPFETWLVPRRHLAAYEDVTDAERRDLARTLGTVAQRLQLILPDAPVGFVLHSAPFGDGDAAFFHWHVEVTAHVSVPTASASESGFPTNPLLPEDAARFLRDPAT